MEFNMSNFRSSFDNNLFSSHISAYDVPKVIIHLTTEELEEKGINIKTKPPKSDLKDKIKKIMYNSGPLEKFNLFLLSYYMTNPIFTVSFVVKNLKKVYEGLKKLLIGNESKNLTRSEYKILKQTQLEVAKEILRSNIPTEEIPEFLNNILFASNLYDLGLDVVYKATKELVEELEKEGKIYASSAIKRAMKSVRGFNNFVQQHPLITFGVLVSAGVVTGVAYKFISDYLKYIRDISDEDNDGLTYAEEVKLGTDPKKADTDGDFWTDKEEILLGTDPLKPSQYEITKIKIGEELAEQLRSLNNDINYRNLVEGLSHLPESGKRALARSGVVTEWAIDNKISDSELRMANDVDLDKIPNAQDKYPFDPLNERRLSEGGMTYMVKLADYNKENGKPLSEIYGIEHLRLARDIVESNPKIANGFDKYGADWLVYFLTDNPDAAKYWRGVNALGLQSQMYFYKYPWERLGFDKPITGMMVNGKYDTDEANIVNTIWRNRVAWQEKGEVLIPMDDSIAELWKDENVQINNLRQSLFPCPVLGVDFKTGKLVPGVDVYNTDTWIKVGAQYNVSQMSKVHDEVWKMLNTEEIQKKAFERVCGFYREPMNFSGELGKKYAIYVEHLFNEGKFLDKQVLLEEIIYLREAPDYPGHESNVEYASMLAWTIGGASYRAEGTLPVGPMAGQGPDGRPAFPVSDYMKEKLVLLGNPTIDPLTNALPARYCDLDIAKNYQTVKFIRVLQPNMTWNYLYRKG